MGGDGGLGLGGVCRLPCGGLSWVLCGRVEYADLSADHVVDLGIEVFHSNADNGELVAYNGGKPCLADDEACQEPVFEYDNGAELTVNFKAPKNVAKLTLKSFDNEEIGAPVAILFKACYEKGWTVDRKWRKAKDVITVCVVEEVVNQDLSVESVIVCAAGNLYLEVFGGGGGGGDVLGE